LFGIFLRSRLRWPWSLTNFNNKQRQSLSGHYQPPILEVKVKTCSTYWLTNRHTGRRKLCKAIYPDRSLQRGRGQYKRILCQSRLYNVRTKQLVVFFLSSSLDGHAFKHIATLVISLNTIWLFQTKKIWAKQICHLAVNKFWHTVI
jgi:hypothetical protein